LNFYLDKYGFVPAQITEKAAANLGIIVVIPCFNEPNLLRSLNSLNDCVKPNSGVEVITVLNCGEHHSYDIVDQNLKTKSEFENWKESNELNVDFHLIHNNNLPKKHAGVGLARKIGMDEAVARFDSIHKDGIIVCFDADAVCESNYLTEIENHFLKHPKTPGCSIHFEHPIEGDDFDTEIYEGIINYELHLRYYNQCLNFCGLPYAYHTVGSSMAVRSTTYQKQGGMNKRKAGEDFYFIHKIIALGGFTELKTTKVIPSPRISDRVPFGTGKAIGDWIAEKSSDYYTYNFKIFEEIKKFNEVVPKFHSSDLDLNTLDVSDTFKTFLSEQNFENRLIEIRNNTTDLTSFKRRFYVWFDAFMILKLVHYLRDVIYPNQEIQKAINSLFKTGKIDLDLTSKKETLEGLRIVERI
jgi:glycosyltransferase involved in cell wall biosynthesis